MISQWKLLRLFTMGPQPLISLFQDRPQPREQKKHERATIIWGQDEV